MVDGDAAVRQAVSRSGRVETINPLQPAPPEELPAMVESDSAGK